MVSRPSADPIISAMRSAPVRLTPVLPGREDDRPTTGLATDWPDSALLIGVEIPTTHSLVLSGKLVTCHHLRSGLAGQGEIE